MSDCRRVPRVYVDSVYHIVRATEHWRELKDELTEDWAKRTADMGRGFDQKGDFEIHLPDMEIVGRAQTIVADVVWHLMAALDNMVYRASVDNCGDIDERTTKFPIENNSEAFDENARRHLRYLPDRQVKFIKALQPFNGNCLLGPMKDMSNSTKHRELLPMTDAGTTFVYYALMSDSGNYPEHRIVPQGRGRALFLKNEEPYRASIQGEHDAVSDLERMIIHVLEIIDNAEHLAMAEFTGTISVHNQLTGATTEI